MSKIINWNKLALTLSGKKENLRSNKIPKKYKEKVNNLFEILEAWEKDEKLISIQKHNEFKDTIKQHLNELETNLNKNKAKIDEIHKLL